MTTPADERPLLSRDDLPELKTYNRAAILEALGSFDEAGMSDEEFILAMQPLLDMDRIPGAEDAYAAGNTTQVPAMVLAACPCEKTPHPSSGPIAQRSAADEVMDNMFTFYGETHQLPESIDWDHNPGTAHWSHDLNRFSYLAALTAACLETSKPEYGRKAVDLMLDWIGKCDLSKCFEGSPYMWGSYLNNAIHCSAWASCLQKLIPLGVVDCIDALRILKSIHDQLAYLEIVTNRHHGNWPTIGCQCMLVTIACLPVLRDTDRFASYCIRTLAEQIEEQVLPDGVQDELTPHYHQVVVTNLLAATKALRLLDLELEPRTLITLEKMIHYSQKARTPDGSKQVAFNDSDPGSVRDLAGVLKPLGLQSMLLREEDIGPDYAPYAGVAFLRQKQTDGDLYLAFDAGPFGRSHQHEDKLGFWLFAYGRSFIVDPGRHLYDWSEVSYLAHLKSTAAHSTIMIDSAGQHSRARPDTWISQGPQDMGWAVSDKEVRAHGVYDLGYGEDNAIDVVHRREIVFAGQRFWLIFDTVEGEGEHLVESRFQFAPCKLSVDGTTAHTCFDDANLLLLASSHEGSATIRVEEGQENPRRGWYSNSYGKICPAPSLLFATKTALPFRTATILYPYQGKMIPDIALSFGGTTATVTCPELGEITVAL